MNTPHVAGAATCCRLTGGNVAVQGEVNACGMRRRSSRSRASAVKHLLTYCWLQQVCRLSLSFSLPLTSRCQHYRLRLRKLIDSFMCNLSAKLVHDIHLHSADRRSTCLHHLIDAYWLKANLYCLSLPSPPDRMKIEMELMSGDRWSVLICPTGLSQCCKPIFM